MSSLNVVYGRQLVDSWSGRRPRLGGKRHLAERCTVRREARRYRRNHKIPRQNVPAQHVCGVRR